MLDIKDLEIRHKRYKLKKNIPYLIIFIILVFIFYAVFFIIDDYNYNEEQILQKSEITTPAISKNEVLPEPLPSVEPIMPIEIIQHVEANNTIIIEEEKEEKKVVLTPSLSFMQKIEPDMSLKDKNINDNKNRALIQNNIEEEIIVKDIQEIKEPLLEDDKKVFVNIERNKDVNDIEHVIKRFKVNNNPALSLFIAKKYYQLGEYEKAYDYALITNKINNNIDASWIIFTKSLVKMNKKEMAVQTLKKYIEYSNSPQGKQLLDEIVSGKFR